MTASTDQLVFPIYEKYRKRRPVPAVNLYELGEVMRAIRDTKGIESASVFAREYLERHTAD